MKIDKQLPTVDAIEPHERRLTQAAASANRTRKPVRETAAAPAERLPGRSASFSLQLNQQLTSMQSAESYLGELAGRLGLLKLNLSRQLGNAAPTEHDGLQRLLDDARDWLEQRAERSGQALDGRFKLRLHEPVRARFSLQGLESIEAIQRAGKETLLFSAGRVLAEPVAVVLDEGMSEQQILRRLNASLGQAGLRAELEGSGALKFSAPESAWRELKGQLAVQGEGKLFAKGQFKRVQSQEDELLNLPASLAHDDQREVRRLLDVVVQALDKIAALRDQLSHRQEEIRDFLARHADRDEQQWALEYAGSLFKVLQQSASSYSAVRQTVVAQANLTRFAVVSLLS